MGRKKIIIKPIQGHASRRATFEKRRIGLLKKAMELSILCDARISLTIERKDEGDFQLYSSEPFDEIIDRYHRFEGTYRLFTNDHILDMIPGNSSSNNVGYQVRKQAQGLPDFDMDINGNVKVSDHAAFQRSQMMDIMPALPNVPSPSLNFARSTMMPILSPQPSFNGYQAAQTMMPRFQFMDSRHALPQFPKQSLNHSNNLMIINEGDNESLSSNEPPLKRMRVDKSSNNTSDTNTLSESPPPLPGTMPRFSVTPPDVQSLDLGVPPPIEASNVESTADKY